MAEVDRVKDQFLASVSHELRTPLSSIIGFRELIPEMEGRDPAVEHFVSIVARNARRKARLVDDLQTLVNTDRGGECSSGVGGAHGAGCATPSRQHSPRLPRREST